MCKFTLDRSPKQIYFWNLIFGIRCDITHFGHNLSYEIWVFRISFRWTIPLTPQMGQAVLNSCLYHLILAMGVWASDVDGGHHRDGETRRGSRGVGMEKVSSIGLRFGQWSHPILGGGTYTSSGDFFSGQFWSFPPRFLCGRKTHLERVIWMILEVKKLMGTKRRRDVQVL